MQELAEAGVDIALEQARGAFQTRTEYESYRKDDGNFHAQAMIDFLRDAEARAYAEGFSGLRVLGEMTWVLGLGAGWEQLIEYEALLNKFLENSRSLILCQYDRQRFDPVVIHDILRTHPVVILGDQVCPNPYYEPPELVLRADATASPAFKGKRVDWWIAQLKRARAASQESQRMLERVQALSRRLLDVQEAERRHLARELHDEIGQLLTGLRLLLRANSDASVDTVRTKFDEGRRLVDELLEKVRGLSFDLRPAALDHLGLLPALLALFERYSKQTGVLVDFKHNGVEKGFSAAVETTAYRIVQEALTNVARHAGVGGATVQIWATPDVLHLRIQDRGRGFDPGSGLTTTRSSGLVGMQERAMLLGGHLTVESRPGVGTELSAELPLRNHARMEQP